VVVGLLEKLESVQTLRNKAGVLNTKNIDNNVKDLDALGVFVEEARAFAEQVNAEELLLEWSQTPFPNLYELVSLVEPFDKFWRLAQSFFRKQTAWLTGSFHSVNAEVLSEEVCGHMRNVLRFSSRLVILRLVPCGAPFTSWPKTWPSMLVPPKLPKPSNKRLTSSKSNYL
jgi:hypothetical protein